MTIKEFLDEITTVFRRSGIMCAENEAMLLACHVLSVSQTYLIIHQDEYIDEKILLASAALINERCKGRPLAYILGVKNFYGIDITVDERVLIPRPETELLVEEALNELNGRENAKVLDLCTGSGCISAAIAANSADTSILASDLSLKALQLAKHNCMAYENVQIIRSDLFEKISDSFDIIISNPPYVAEKYRIAMQKEVKDFEPELALFAGEDGMDVITKIMPQIDEHLLCGGLFLMEIGADQAEAVENLARKSGVFAEVAIRKDLAGLPRYLKARKY